MDAEKAVGGIDPRTFASKLRDYNSGKQIRNGMAEALRNLDNTLPTEQKFLQQVNKIQKEYATQKYLEDNINQGALRNIANFDNLPLNEQNILNSIAKDEINAYQNLLDEQNAIKNTLGTISEKYKDNPRPLADKDSLRFENAISDLENRSGIKFFDELRNIRAREALEQMTPGRINTNTGSGSIAGFLNNVIRPTLVNAAKVGTASTIGGLIGGPVGGGIGTGLGLLAVSPKFTAKGTIQNLGRINNFVNSPLAESVIRPLYPISAINAIDLLYDNN